MDALTHMIIGGITAQIPQVQSADTRSSRCTGPQNINWHTRTVIGAFAAIFPDIDYLLFWLNPLEFLAYWHRAETHSIILAPLWSLLITYAIVKLTSVSNKKLIFTIVLLGALSHIVSDSFTVFGTRWFAPLSDVQTKWNLLFVIEPYFTLSLIITGCFLYLWRDKKYRYAALSFPLVYLLFVLGIKLHLSQKIEHYYVKQNNSNQQFELLPQPFSPFYWQVLSKHQEAIEQSYIKLTNDPIASTISQLLGIANYSQNFSQVRLISHNYIEHLDQTTDSELARAWHQVKFKAFRDFTDYPVFLEQTNSNNETCFWFSDLRYHWPEITPSFRYAMCRNEQDLWQVRRLKYFSDKEQKVGN